MRKLMHYLRVGCRSSSPDAPVTQPCHYRKKKKKEKKTAKGCHLAKWWTQGSLIEVECLIYLQALKDVLGYSLGCSLKV